MIPGDFPKWRTVHSYFQRWSEVAADQETGLLEQALKKCGHPAPHRTGPEWESQFLHHGRAEREKHRLRENERI
jgi:hypothetical protein